MKAGFAMAMLAVLLSAGQTRAADGASSSSWQNKRVGLWLSVCAATAPSFAKFKSTARASGFKVGPEGYYHYGQTEIVASLQKSGGGCNCRVSFGTDNPNLAGTTVGAKLLAKYGSKFQPDHDSKSLGKLTTADGPLSVRVQTWKQFGGNWMGILIYGKRRCPV